MQKKKQKKKPSKNELLMHKIMGEHDFRVEYEQDPMNLMMNAIKTCMVCGYIERDSIQTSGMVSSAWGNGQWTSANNWITISGADFAIGNEGDYYLTVS